MDEKEKKKLIDYFISMGVPKPEAIKAVDQIIANLAGGWTKDDFQEFVGLTSHFLSKGVPLDWTIPISTQIMNTDITGWTEDQFQGYVNDWVTQAQTAAQGRQPAWQNQPTWKSPLGTVTGGKASLSVTPPVGQGTPRMKTPEELGTDLFGWFEGQGIKPERAEQLANQLSQINYTDWSDSDRDRYWREWADLAKKQQYDKAIGDYISSYNPQTGRARSEEQIILGPYNQGNQLAIQQSNEYRQQQVARKVEEWESKQPGMPSPNIAIQETLQRLKAQGASPNMLRFYENEARRLFTEGNMSELRRFWWEEKTRFPGMEPGGETGGGLQPLEGDRWYMETPEQTREREQPHKEWEEQQEIRKNLPDPWAEFLKQQDFFTQFRSLTPREKGEQPSRYRPPTRFL